MRLVFLGAPGSGKGTQADILKEKRNLIKLSTGDVLRAEMRAESSLGIEARKFVDAGKLVPDSVMIGILEEKTASFKAEGTGYILDGFPRTVPQAEALDAMLAAQNAPLDAVILIDVPEDELMKRLASRWTCRQCGATISYYDGKPEGASCKVCGGELYQREDDTPVTIQKRFDVYNANTRPLIDYYEKSGLLRRVKGLGTIEEIASRLDAELEAL